jgi:dienelactone hydrolase
MKMSDRWLQLGYVEGVEVGSSCRMRLDTNFKRQLSRRQEAAAAIRDGYFSPDTSSPEAYARSLMSYRQRLRLLLGWPLDTLGVAHRELPSAVSEIVLNNDVAIVERLFVESPDGIVTYGVLLIPKVQHDGSLAIVQHGGQGTPEMICGLTGNSENYNDVASRLIARGVAVFAPQLRIWRDHPDFGPPIMRTHAESAMRQVGGSMAAFEATQLIHAIDYLLGRAEFAPNRLGMIGHSYGGFYTLLTAALDDRVRAAVCSCFLNNRLVTDYAWNDWSWRGSAHMFLDAELAAMCAPRPLWFDAAKQDQLIRVTDARAEYERARRWYQDLGASERLVFHTFEGRHEFDPEDAAIDWFCEQVRAQPKPA